MHRSNLAWYTRLYDIPVEASLKADLHTAELHEIEGFIHSWVEKSLGLLTIGKRQRKARSTLKLVMRMFPRLLLKVRRIKAPDLRAQHRYLMSMHFAIASWFLSRSMSPALIQTAARIILDNLDVIHSGFDGTMRSFTRSDLALFCLSSGDDELTRTTSRRIWPTLRRAGSVDERALAGVVRAVTEGRKAEGARLLAHYINLGRSRLMGSRERTVLAVAALAALRNRQSRHDDPLTILEQLRRLHPDPAIHKSSRNPRRGRY